MWRLRGMAAAVVHFATPSDSATVAPLLAAKEMGMDASERAAHV
jgi:hypothetical protein